MLLRDDHGRITGNAFSGKVADSALKHNEDLSMLLGRQALSSLVGQQYHGVRDIDTVLGYTINPEIRDFQARYDRRGLAATIVDAPAKTAWRKPPTITDGSDGASTFLKAWEKLNKRLHIYHFLERIDRLSGIGSYGVLLIGSKTGELSEPLTAVSGPEDIIFLSPFSETYAKIVSYVPDTKDPRFGQPLMYRIRVGGDLISTRAVKTADVHYTRVIHVAEGLLENEVYGEPRLRKVFNRLEDLDKIVGSSAEGFWQAAAPSYSITPKKDFDLDPTAMTAAADELQKVIHGMQRYIASEGIDIETLNGSISSPKDAFDVVISLVSGKTGIPKRILLGSERGELASSQDEANWLGRVAQRQEQHVEPMILRPLIQRFIDINALPAPAGGEYGVTWEALFYLNELEIAMVHLRNAQAIKSVTGDGEGAEEVVTKGEKRVMLGLPAKPEDVE